MWRVCFCFPMWAGYSQIEILSKSELRRELWVEHLFRVLFSKKMVMKTIQLEEITRKSDSKQNEIFNDYQNLRESLGKGIWEVSKKKTKR